EAGILIAANASALGAVGPGNETLVSPGAQLLTNFSGTSMEALSLSGRHAPDHGALEALQGSWGGPVTVAHGECARRGCGGDQFTISGRITGPGALNKFGGGTLTLTGTGDNNYAGSTTIPSGTLSLNKPGGVAVPENSALSGAGTLSLLGGSFRAAAGYGV